MAEKNIKPRRDGADTDLAADAKGPGADEVQSAMDEATRQGFFGSEIDSTPNEAYSVQGVLKGEPTPETDKDQRRKVAGEAEEAQGRF